MCLSLQTAARVAASSSCSSVSAHRPESISAEASAARKTLVVPTEPYAVSTAQARW
ncbi:MULTISPECIES: hypothetical protein [Streptomyces]|uniref:hypothetical protein n=1 Tax=Streptomyces TaxID=1883 RepID=UPI0012FF11B2|nr:MULTISPECIES: hypothetical protein [Streptomyces]